MRDRRLEFELPQPYDVDWVLDFFARRTVGGLERVEGRCYERSTPAGVVAVRFSERSVDVAYPSAADPDEVAKRVRALLDLDADPLAVEDALAGDAEMSARVGLRPGLRVPGAWDPFELAVRAVLGQQVSVERGTRLVAELVARYGVPADDGSAAFPAPARLLAEDRVDMAIPGRRAHAIRALAAAADAGRFAGPGLVAGELRSTLTGMAGIGPWTREYIAMRAGRDPDAFPDSDWVVLRELDTTPAGARRRAEAWRPYRAYAVMYLWAAAARRKGIR